MSDLRNYVRRLQEALASSTGRAVVLSQRDWHLAKTWFEAGIPVGLPLDALRRRAWSSPRGLSAIAREVEGTWGAVVAGRSVSAAETPGPSPPPDEPLNDLRAARDAAEPGSDLSALLDEALRRAEGGEDPASVDALLDEGLEERAPEVMLERARTEAADSLKSFRDRMNDEVYQRTLRGAVIQRVRRGLRLPRLRRS